MLDKVKSNEPLSPVRAVQWPGGTDIWLRKNMKGPLTEESAEGFNSAFFEADEAFVRIRGSVDEETVAADFERYWAMAVAFDPDKKPETVSNADMLEMIADIDCRLIMQELGV